MGYYVCHEKDLCKKATCGTPTCNSSARETRWLETLSQKNKVTAVSAVLQPTRTGLHGFVCLFSFLLKVKEIMKLGR